MIRVMVNQALQFERENFLNVRAFERSEDRTGYANGYKPKTVNTRVGKVKFTIPQVHEGFLASDSPRGMWKITDTRIALLEMENLDD